ncbi:MAG: hypothetical protein K0Q67_2826 [Cellvibrio sp.]|jgi:hypothetical protein|nr:hypothetical protein [Cellvibrio sp.]
MSKVSSIKVGLALLVAIAFSNTAKAVIIEGTFNGTMWEWQSTNMENHADADFFSHENAFREFTGEFWYDTALASAPVLRNEFFGESATYAGPHNWMHTSVIGYNGAVLDLTSSGSAPTFTSSQREEISVSTSDYMDLIQLSYNDGELHGHNSETYRVGFIDFRFESSFLNDLDLVLEHTTNNRDLSVMGYMEFWTIGKQDGVDYFGWMVAQVNNFSIRIKEPVTVAEPSILLLFLGSLLFLLWRAGILTTRSEQKI